MGDIRSIATAVEAYSTDLNFTPKVASNRFVASALDSYITPTFMRRIPGLDAWREGIGWVSTTAGDSYTLYSFAKDTAIGTWNGGPKTDFGDDIVYSNGQFYQYPEGMQVGS
jgi:hypothetical protein